MVYVHISYRLLPAFKSEMEFLKGSLSRAFWANTCVLSLSDSSFRLVFFPRFLFYKMLFMNRLEFFCFADFYVWSFKTTVEYGFL
jgi:hypothetical protein